MWSVLVSDESIVSGERWIRIQANTRAGVLFGSRESGGKHTQSRRISILKPYQILCWSAHGVQYWIERSGMNKKNGRAKYSDTSG